MKWWLRGRQTHRRDEEIELVTGTDLQCGQPAQEKKAVRGLLNRARSRERRLWKSKETLDPPHFIKAASNIREDKRQCDKAEIPTGVDADRWTVRHAACASASVCGCRSLGVRPRSMGVRTGPGKAGAGGTTVPTSVPVWGRWDLHHGGLLGVGTIFCANQPQPSHHLPVSNTFPVCVNFSLLASRPLTVSCHSFLVFTLCISFVILIPKCFTFPVTHHGSVPICYIWKIKTCLLIASPNY